MHYTGNNAQTCEIPAGVPVISTVVHWWSFICVCILQYLAILPKPPN